MKKFLTKVVVFIVPIILLVASMAVYFHQNRAEVDQKLKTVSRHDYLILGDSQMRRILPEYFNGVAYNFASAGEHYYFTYCKLKKILAAENSKTRYVVLGVSAHNFSPMFNKSFNVKDPMGRLNLSRYVYFFENALENPFYHWKDVLFDKYIYKGVFEGPEWGGYYASDAHNPDTNIINTGLQIHYNFKDSADRYCESQEIYLQRISNLCMKKGIELIIVSPPYHNYYKERVDSFYFNKLEENISRLNIQTHADFTKFNVPDSLMADGDHLNKKGAIIYSKRINAIINSKD